MTKLNILAATALATSLIAAPAMAAQDNTPAHAKLQTQKVHKSNKHAQMHVRDNHAAQMNYQRGFDRRAQFDNGYRPSTTTYDDGSYADNGYYNRGYDNGFWPADVATSAVTGAVSTAGAIATAPFRDTYAFDNSYAYDNGYTPAPVDRSNVVGSYDGAWNDNYGWGAQTYGQRNGFVCTPGSWYTNEYGRSQLCQ